MKIENPKVLEAAYQDSLMVQYPYMTQEQFNSSLDILEASTGVRPSVTFEGFVDHTLLKEARLQQKKIAAGGSRIRESIACAPFILPPGSPRIG